MGRTLWKVFTSLLNRNVEEATEEEESESFVPSPLDLSVRFSHGGTDKGIERELHTVNEKARELEDERCDR